jgi:putative sterol carrier protein
MPYPFLSDQWIEAAHALREEYRDAAPSAAAPVRMNLVVTEVPFDDADVRAHMDTSSGEVVLDKGHLEAPDLTVTVDYATAKAILVDGNPQAGMQAFMNGKIRVEGDMAKLMALQAAPAPAAQELAGRLRDITE